MNMKKLKCKIFKIATIIILLAGSVFTSSRCGVESNIEGNATLREGLVRDFGSPAVDGCGWVIIVNDSIYAPVEWNLDEKFCKNNLKIYIDYKKLSTFRDCNWWSQGQYDDPYHVYPEIKILTIKIR